MMTAKELIEYIKDNYPDDAINMRVGFRIWNAIDVFYALHREKEIIPNGVEYSTFENTHPIEHYVFMEVVVPELLDYASYGIREISELADHYTHFLSQSEDFISDCEDARNEYIATKQYGESAEADVFVALMRGAK
jgi:hypothetical protein